MTHRPAGEQPRGSAAALSLALAEALASRLCHDLAGGLGTVIGALELASEDPESAAEAIPTAWDAARMLGLRLAFMRAAWGGGDVLDVAGLREVSAGMAVGRRVAIRLEGLSVARRFSPQGGRLLLNLLLLGVESLAGEGVVAVADAGGSDVLLTLQGPRAAWPAGLAGQFADAETALDAATHGEPRHLQAPLAALIAHAAGLRVRLLLGPSTQGAPPLIATLG